jgi:hypothetical protein
MGAELAMRRGVEGAQNALQKLAILQAISRLSFSRLPFA